MTKRERIMTGMGVSGGTNAPGSRRSQIKQALGGAQAKGPVRSYLTSSGGTVARAKERSPAGISGNYQPKLGRQLSNRVQSGAINQKQALRTAGQRQLLQKAFGKDWRTQVFGQGGAKAARGFGVAGVRAKRSQALERAKKKLY